MSIDAHSKNGVNIGVQVTRGVAACMVVIDHVGQHIWENNEIKYHNIIEFFTLFGAFGVKIFFVISGYIMITTNSSGFGSASRSLNFIKRRFLRVAPAYYVGTVLALILLVVIFKKQIDAYDIIASLFFIPHYGNIENVGFYPVLGVGWTLNYEMFFYLIFAISLNFPRKLGISLLFFLMLLLPVIDTFSHGSKMLCEECVLTFYSRKIVLFFLAGVMLGIFLDYISVARIQPFFGMTYVAIFLAMIAFAIISLLVMPDYLKILNVIFAILATPIVFLAAKMHINLHDKIVDKLKYIGDTSYSIYLFHTILILILIDLIMTYSNVKYYVIFLITLPVTLTISIYCFSIVEKPLNRFFSIKKPPRINPGI